MHRAANLMPFVVMDYNVTNSLRDVVDCLDKQLKFNLNVVHNRGNQIPTVPLVEDAVVNMQQHVQLIQIVVQAWTVVQILNGQTSVFNKQISHISYFSCNYYSL
jgi:hypothetical protein